MGNGFSGGALSPFCFDGEQLADGVSSVFDPYLAPLFPQECVGGRGGSGLPDPDFNNQAISNARRSPTARRFVDTGSRTTTDRPTAGPCAQSGMAAVRRL